MVGLLVKLAILAGAIFGVAYALTKSRQSKKHIEMTRELREAQARFRELKAALDEGRLSEDEKELLRDWASDPSAAMPEGLEEVQKRLDKEGSKA